MKKLIILLMFVPFLINAQTISSPKTISSDQDYAFAYADTLVKNGVISQYFYVKDFCQDLSIEIELDTLVSGYLKTNTVVYGSLNYRDWVVLANTDTTCILTAGENEAYSKSLYKDVFDKYIKVTTTAIDSTQYDKFKYRILFNTNK